MGNPEKRMKNGYYRGCPWKRGKGYGATKNKIGKNDRIPEVRTSVWTRKRKTSLRTKEEKMSCAVKEREDRNNPCHLVVLRETLRPKKEGGPSKFPKDGQRGVTTQSNIKQQRRGPRSYHTCDWGTFVLLKKKGGEGGTDRKQGAARTETAKLEGASRGKRRKKNASFQGSGPRLRGVLTKNLSTHNRENIERGHSKP